MNKFVGRIKSIRQEAQKSRVRLENEQLEYPISFWTKKDRLIHEIGKEFTIILRTKGCSWALSESGGCSMCGYIKDANIEDVSDAQIINQFNHALNKKLSEINQGSDNYVLKIFNSGSFFDENEVSEKVRRNIYEKIAKIENFKEFVIESRCEYITTEKLEELREKLDKKYIEVAIGLETANDNIRNNYINKGLLFNDFKNTFGRCKAQGIGVKAYLLFKPPFLNEQAAIDDCSNSIKKLIDLKINSISINPMNIQRDTLIEYLWYKKKYRPPWFYSLFKCLKKSIKQKNLEKIRILSDPSGAGTKRGIHNCLTRECENSAKIMLNNFVLSQDLSELEREGSECKCKKKYQLQKKYM